MSRTMLTTVDNPYNPFDNYEQWLSYDRSVGHNTNELLARVISYSDELSDEDKEVAIEKAIDDIVKEDPTLTYKKISKD